MYLWEWAIASHSRVLAADEIYIMAVLLPFADNDQKILSRR
jgi:hypothetical protein